MPKLRPLRVSLALLFAEAAALAYAALALAWGDIAVAYAGSNQAERVYRLGFGLVPLAAGALASLTAYVVARVKPARLPALAALARRAAPLLALWPVPVLARRGVMGGDPLLLAACIAACALGLERSLTYAGFGAQRRLGPGPALRRWVPRALTGLALLGVFGFGYVHSVQVHYKLLTSNYDFGLFENLFYNTLHGRHGLALGARYFSQHAEFLLYALLPFYAVWQRSETLFALQALLIVGAAVPLYLLAERWLKSSWAACVLALVYVCSPAVHGPLLFDFHFLPLSAFFILWGAYFYARRRWVLLWIAVVLALSCREDVAIGIAALGLGLLACGRTRRTALGLLGAGVAWFLLVKFVWMRRYGGQAFADYYAALIPRGEGGFGAVIGTLLSNPLYTLGKCLTADKGLLALQLLAPFAFLPVRQWGTWFLLIPGLVVIGLATSWAAISQVQFHYATHFLPYLALATVLGLAARPARVRPPLLLAMLLGALLTTIHFGAFFTKTFKTSFHEVSLEYDWQDAERHAEFQVLAAQIPSEASVSAGEYEGPQLARRERLFALKQGIRGAEFVVYSRESLRWGGAEAIRQALTQGQYGVVDTRADFVLLRRGASTARNQQAVNQIAGLR